MEELLPSECKNLGDFAGSPVYVIHRSLPSGSSEYFVQLGETFLFVREGGDGGASLDYLKTFKALSRSQAKAALKTNSDKVSQVLDKQRAAQAATDRTNRLAYTRLDFTPTLPSILPTGWSQPTVDNIRLDGPDAEHPHMVILSYTNNDQQYVSVYSARLSDFTLGTQCGPTPGYSMRSPECHRVAGTDYYEASPTETSGMYIRYLYRPIGDSLLISQIAILPEARLKASWRDELIKTQDTITRNARPIEKDSLKGSSYEKQFYD